MCVAFSPSVQKSPGPEQQVYLAHTPPAVTGQLTEFAGQLLSSYTVCTLWVYWSAGSGSGYGRAERKKGRNFKVWNAGFSLMKAGGFSCSLDVLYEDQGINLWQFLIKKIKKFVSTFPFLFVLLITVVPRAQKKKTNALQVPLPRRLSWPCVSDLHWFKRPKAGNAPWPSMTRKPQLRSYTIRVWSYETFIVSSSSSSG